MSDLTNIRFKSQIPKLSRIQCKTIPNSVSGYVNTKRKSTFCKVQTCFYPNLQLGLFLFSQEIRHQQVADLQGSFIEIETHALSAESLADDVELEAEEIISIVTLYKKKRKNSPVLVDHISNAKPIVDNLAPSVSVEVLGAELRG
jgi:hypothetical protein